MSGRPLSTHTVTNQSPPFGGLNLFLADRPLREAVDREGAGASATDLSGFGEACGSRHGFEIGRLANEHPPRLRRFDEKGHPLDVVEFHPAWHEAMAMSIAEGLNASPWEHLVTTAAPQPGRHVARAAGLYMVTQMEPGHVCPITMTNASVPVLLTEPSLAQDWLPRIVRRTYDRSFRPWTEKTAVTLGMGMTEKQGGTDVRANTTTARPLGAGGRAAAYALTGHKWFLSAPMSDAFLMLAQAPRGLSCFLVPRIMPDGHVNAIRIERLKDKLGNRSNASSEVELTEATGFLVGDEGRGVATIIEMVTMTRLDCAVASAGQMRLALAMALDHCRHRIVFQRKLADQPLMARVMADMALDVEAATALAFRLARAFDEADGDAAAAAWRRVMTPVTKYYVCKLAPSIATEAMECLGGNGYVEEGLAARLYREAPLNAIWEGAGNVMALDLLRVAAREPATLAVVIDTIEAITPGDARIASATAALRRLVATAGGDEALGRTFVDRLAATAAAALLIAHAPARVADPYAATRLAGCFSHSYGAHAEPIDAPGVLDRALEP
ncbi:MAG: acyl-CoA dehydrogenase family protein [Hyphomicrobiaceae bacterium]